MPGSNSDRNQARIQVLVEFNKGSLDRNFCGNTTYGNLSLPQSRGNL